MKCYLPELKEEHTTSTGERGSVFLFRSVKRIFDFIDSEDINIHISVHTFYAYTKNFARDRIYIPAAGLPCTKTTTAPWSCMLYKHQK